MEAGAPLDLQAWRKLRRDRLLAARAELPPAEHTQRSRLVLDLLNTHFAQVQSVIGFYWAFRGEVCVLPVIERHVAEGGKGALPVVVGRGQPLGFREWKPGCAMQEGALGIPYPAKGPYLQPEILVIPLLGFDAAGYRLGYGGGYYDRTLAAANPKPRTIGIGFELGRLATIHPQGA